MCGQSKKKDGPRSCPHSDSGNLRLRYHKAEFIHMIKLKTLGRRETFMNSLGEPDELRKVLFLLLVAGGSYNYA